MAYLLVLLSVVGLAVQFALTKLWQQRMGTGLRTGLVFNGLVALLSAAVLFAVNGFRPEFTWFSGLLAVGMGIACGAYTLLGFPLIERCGVSVYTLFLMLGGMVLPYLYGLIWLEEPFSLLRTLGLVLIAAALVIAGGGASPGSKQNSRWNAVLCLLVFLFNGCVSIVSKAHQVEAVYATVSSGGFSVLGNLARAVLTGVALLFVRRQKAESKGGRLDKRMAAVLVASAVISGVSYLLQLIGAAELPATVLYPLITGGSIILTALADRIAFKEKLTPRLYASIGLCFAATLLFL